MDTRTDDTASADTRSNALDSVNAAERALVAARADHLAAIAAAALANTERERTRLALARAHSALDEADRDLDLA